MRRSTPGPYTFSIGDRLIAGEHRKTPAAARRRAAKLAALHGTTITILRDDYAISFSGISPYGPG